jgi:hypothetical protein
MRSAVNRQKPQGAIDARADFQADEHEEATAEFGQDAEGQESRIDAKRAKMRRCEWSFEGIAGLSAAMWDLAL